MKLQALSFRDIRYTLYFIASKHPNSVGAWLFSAWSSPPPRWTRCSILRLILDEWCPRAPDCRGRPHSNGSKTCRSEDSIHRLSSTETCASVYSNSWAFLFPVLKTQICIFGVWIPNKMTTTIPEHNMAGLMKNASACNSIHRKLEFNCFILAALTEPIVTESKTWDRDVP